MGSIYFLSDVHLGAQSTPVEAAKERALVAFLDGLRADARLYLLGDVFDFWFDFDGPPPAAYLPTLRSLRRCVDRGIPVSFMGGNHDFWARVGSSPGWLEREIGLELIDDPHRVRHGGWRLLLTHGDALGGARGSYRLIRAILRHPVATAAFGVLPARLGYRIADLASRLSRSRHHEEALARYRTELVKAAEGTLARTNADAVIAGHVHHPERRETAHGVYLNLGDWLTHRTYGRLADDDLSLERFREADTERSRTEA